ncbi:MAG: hypothetical protein FJ297_05020 [Planctomycetes bacterium]|nr:hypothetical protein [Planctomycetota bacterium]
MGTRTGVGEPDNRLLACLKPCPRPARCRGWPRVRFPPRRHAPRRCRCLRGAPRPRARRPPRGGPCDARDPRRPPRAAGPRPVRRRAGRRESACGR